MKNFKDIKRTTISESPLNFGEIIRPDRAFRADLFIKKMKLGEPFEGTDGKPVVIKYNKKVEDAIISGSKKGLGLKPLETQNGDFISFGRLKKNTEFGGGGRGSGGGSDNTRATESAQCVYLKLMFDNPKTEFTPEEIGTTYSDMSGNVDATGEEILLKDEQWVRSSKICARVLYRALGRSKKPYTFHRGSSWVDGLENKWKELNRQEKLFKNINKWSPADIYIVARGSEAKYNILNAESIAEMNNELLKAFIARDILGVSLKKIGKRVKLVQVNVGRPFNEPEFTAVSYGKRDYFKAKDGYLLGKDIEIQFRTFPTFQCEIIGKKAKHGKVSYGGISDAMKDAVGRPLTDKKTLEQLHKKNPKAFFKQFYQKYSKTYRPVSEKEFMSNLKGKSVDWLMSKYMVTELFTSIKGKEKEVFVNLFRIAKSQTKNSAVHLKIQ